MIDDLNTEAQRMAAKEKSLLSVKRSLKWWTIALVLLVIVILGLVGVSMFRNPLPGVKGSKTGSSAAYMGVEIQDLKESITDALDLRYSGGVAVTRVIPSSPAAEADLKSGDIILRYDRSKVESSTELQELLAAASPGDAVRIVLDRDGQVRTLYVKLGQRPSYLIQTASTSTAQTDPGAEWGYTLSPLTPDLVQKLSLPSSIRGVAVVAVSPSGLTNSAEVLPGDVIVSVNRQPTPTLASFYKAIEDQPSVVLKIYRSGQEVYLQLQAGSVSPPLATIAGSLTEGIPLPSLVAVAATGSDLNAQVATRFGTAPYFLMVDMATNRFMAIPNNAIADARGYGIAAAQLVAARGAKATIAGAYGPQAYDTLKALSIILFVASPVKISDSLSQYRSGLLSQVTEPTLPGYGYARSIITTGGSPFSSDSSEED
ncbi:MAG: PDZ domain-containing protein, partial [Deltaproteobacteria bacterium]|nr:PDZ domain-containing protein [Deltaproteobacteria bacterium]